MSSKIYTAIFEYIDNYHNTYKRLKAVGNFPEAAVENLLLEFSDYITDGMIIDVYEIKYIDGTENMDYVDEYIVKFKPTVELYCRNIHK